MNDMTENRTGADSPVAGGTLPLLVATAIVLALFALASLSINYGLAWL